MSSFEGLYNIREGRPEDHNFILSTFLKGLYYGDSWFSLIDKQVFMTNYKPVAEHLIKHGIIKVACLPNDTDTILGYSILGKDAQTIHWVYVKNAKLSDGTSSWRKHGIARALLPKHPTTVTHLTEVGKQLMHKFLDLKFNPFKLN